MRVSFALLPAVALGKRQVYISRHCVRSTAHDDDIKDYSDQQIVDWQVPTNWCTERGMDIMISTGKELMDNFGVDPTNVRFISDTEMRDGDTAFALMKGMDIQHAPIDYDALVFSTTEPESGSPVCDAPSEDVVAEERKARYNEVPLPQEYKSALAELQDIIGVGPAGKLEDIDGVDAGIVVSDEGKPTGAAYVMKLFGQAMLYAYASELPFLNATEEQINKFIAWQFWYRSVTDVNSEKATENAFLFRSILDHLKAGSGTDIYLGHDGNLDGLAAVLGLRWDAAPYVDSSAHGEMLPTPPGGGLMFEYDEDNESAGVKVSYIYRVFNPADAEFKLTQVNVAEMGSLSDFEQTMMKGLSNFQGAEACFAKAPHTVVV
jgi:hypothetical protein